MVAVAPALPDQDVLLHCGREAMADPSTLIDAYLRKRADLVRFFTLRMGGAAAAEDLVQDLYVRLREIAAPEDLRSPDAFLYRMGTNLMLDRLKAARRTQGRDRAWSEAVIGFGSDPAVPEPSQDDVLGARQTLYRLLSALERLPPRVAAAFRLHKFDGLSHEETADRLGVSKSSVEKYLMTALKALAAELDP